MSISILRKGSLMYSYQPNKYTVTPKPPEKSEERQEESLFEFDKDIVNDGKRPKNDNEIKGANTEKYSGVYMPPILLAGGKNALEKPRKVPNNIDNVKENE